MILIVSNDGQLCNKLIFFAHCLATGIESSQDVVHLCAHHIRQVVELDRLIGKQFGFRSLACDRIQRIALVPIAFSRLFNKIIGIRVRPGAKTIGESHAFIEAHYKNAPLPQFHMVHDWYFRNPDALFRQKETILRYLRVKQKFYTRPLEILAAARQSYDKVVGVHMRRGDYKFYRKGSFYYSDETYRRWLAKISKITSTKTCFLLCSNEPVNYDFFRKSGLNIIAPPNHSIEDLVALSLCDSILGPPSTYSWWAAFSGNVPLCHLMAPNEDVELSRFRYLEPGSYP